MPLLRIAAVALLLGGLLAGCHTVPKTAFEGIGPVLPANGEAITIDELYIIADVSGSMFTPDKFRLEKKLLDAFGKAMPDGNYQVQLDTFGGEWQMDWLRMPLAPFHRGQVATNIDRIRFLAGYTPLSRALDNLREPLAGKGSRAAVLIFSDGQSDNDGAALAAARNLLSLHPGSICFHTVHVGCEEDGADLMQQISMLTSCGTTRHADDISNIIGLENLVRDVFFGPGVSVAVSGVVTPGDSDGDGVPDVRDLCPDTPAGERVNGYGCSNWASILFEKDKAYLRGGSDAALDAVVARLAANPGYCLRVEGHADASERNAQHLSQQRAQAVANALVARGAEAGRLIVSGLGATKPAAPATNAPNRQLNRRVELMPLP
jgi:hypothetical protein